MKALQTLDRFRAACDRYGVRSGSQVIERRLPMRVEAHEVYRRTATTPGSMTERRALFSSQHRSDCVEWIERRAMAG